MRKLEQSKSLVDGVSCVHQDVYKSANDYCVITISFNSFLFVLYTTLLFVNIYHSYALHILIVNYVTKNARLAREIIPRTILRMKLKRGRNAVKSAHYFLFVCQKKKRYICKMLIYDEQIFSLFFVVLHLKYTFITLAYQVRTIMQLHRTK